MLSRSDFPDNIIPFEGTKVKVDFDGQISVGDLYLAQRNGPVKLLTCKEIHPNGYIRSIENAYPYDTWECVKVVNIL